MNLSKRIKKLNFLLLLKTGFGSAIAIFIANRFNLLYSASAGIITLLTIQNTKKETINIAFKRMLAFLVAIIVAYIVFSRVGYTPIAFGGFIFIFVAICNLFGLQDGISMNAVLTTHFLIEKTMNPTFIMNEVFLLIIGMSIGIILNLIMPKNMKKIKEEQKVVEGQIRSILSCMSSMLKGNKECLQTIEDKENIDLAGLSLSLDNLLLKAYEEAGNTLLVETQYQISYLEMRKLQIVVLKDIFENIVNIHDILSQSIEVSRYMEKVAEEFHELNNVKSLLLELEELYKFFRNETLPTTRDEFENRAILFNILRDLEHFLQIKKSFIEKSINL